MKPVPVITTNRTYLLSPQELTLDQIRILDSDPQVMKYIGKGVPRTIQESQKWLNTNPGN